MEPEQSATGIDPDSDLKKDFIPISGRLTSNQFPLEFPEPQLRWRAGRTPSLQLAMMVKVIIQCTGAGIKSQDSQKKHTLTKL